MVSILTSAKSYIYRIGLTLVFVMLVSCATQPEQQLVAKNAYGSGVNEAARYQTRSQSVPPAVLYQLKEAKQQMNLRQFQSALSLLERVQRMAPNYSPVYMQMGKAYLGLNQKNKAEQMYRRAASLAVNDEQYDAAVNAIQREGF